MASHTSTLQSLRASLFQDSAILDPLGLEEELATSLIHSLNMFNMNPTEVVLANTLSDGWLQS